MRSRKSIERVREANVDPAFPFDGILEDLVLGKDRAAWERCRISRATSRVYRIPLAGAEGEFVIAKLLPGRWDTLRSEWKIRLRNLIYGEQDIADLGKLFDMEIERYAEWRKAGFHVPRVIQTRLKNVRIIEGLKHPTLKEILDSEVTPLTAKVDAVELATQALSHQCRVALEKGAMSLVHRDPGSGNIIVDLGSRKVYWIDLEQPADYPRMTLDGLMVKATRSFLYSALYRRSDETLPAFVQRAVAAYEPKHRLWDVVDSIENRSLLFRVMGLLGVHKRTYERQRHIARRLANELCQQGEYRSTR